MALRHWKLERDADGLAWATLDVADAADILEEMEPDEAADLVIRVLLSRV